MCGYVTIVVVSQYGKTAFHRAADKPQLEIVKMMLQCERFIEIDAKDNVSDKLFDMR
jgi:hypothetical protein